MELHQPVMIPMNSKRSDNIVIEYNLIGRSSKHMQ